MTDDEIRAALARAEAATDCGYPWAESIRTLAAEVLRLRSALRVTRRREMKRQATRRCGTSSRGTRSAGPTRRAACRTSRTRHAAFLFLLAFDIGETP